MKIAFIEPHLKYGIGGIRRVVTTCNCLQKLGHDISIYVPGGKPCTWIPNQILTCKLEKITKDSFDIVLFNLAEQYKTAQAAKAKKKVFWVLAPEALYKNPTIPLQALSQKDFYFVANSTFTQQYIKMRRPDLKYNPPIIPGGISKEHFRYDPSIKKEYHVIYYGSSRPWKGTRIIETALNGTGLKIFKMEGAGIRQEDMYKAYNKAHICVVANQCEGFSFIELESMACGCCVVTTDSGGNRDYVVNGKNAIVVLRDLGQIRNAVVSMTKNFSLVKQLVAGGLKTASEDRFNWDNCTKKLEQVFVDILK